ncbi:MAG: hypothetical protein H6621_06905 [Halobacteriovoraceae bacterium]|nr:hypothetical protein [Halobacteriovoraceae bacterium]
MKFLVFILALVSIQWGFSQEEEVKTKMKMRSHKQSLQPSLGMGRGGVIAGIDYERHHRKVGGYGFYLRLYQEDEEDGARGMTLLGALIRPHFRKGPWDFNITFGMGFNMVKGIYNQDDETALGGVWGASIAYNTGHNISFGVENIKAYGIFASDYKGIIADDIVFKAIVPF